MKKIIYLLVYAFIISNNFNITAMDEPINTLAIIQKTKGLIFYKSKINKLFNSGNYSTVFDDDNDNIGNKIKSFIANQNNKDVYIYTSNNNILETISELTQIPCNGNIILMMNEPSKSNISNITQLPEHIRPIILYNLDESPAYKNPMPGIPLIGYNIKNYEVILAHENTGTSNLRSIINKIKKSEQTPNNQLTLAVDTIKNILKQTPTPDKKIKPNSHLYKYIGYTAGFGFLLCILLYKSGATEKLLRFLH